MKIKELFPDVISEDQNFEYKSVLNPDNPIKWAKTIVGYANSDGGVIFVGVSDDGEAFGLDLGAVDQTKNLISKVNDRHIFPHAKISYVLRNVDAEAEHFVLGVRLLQQILLSGIEMEILMRKSLSEAMVILRLLHRKRLLHCQGGSPE